MLAIVAMVIIFIYGGIDNLKKEDQTKNSTQIGSSDKTIPIRENNNSYLDKFAAEQIQPKNKPTSSPPVDVPKRGSGGFMPPNFIGPSSPPSVVGPPGPPPGY